MRDHGLGTHLQPFQLGDCYMSFRTKESHQSRNFAKTLVGTSDGWVTAKQGYLCYRNQMLSDDRSQLLGRGKIVVCYIIKSHMVVTGWQVRHTCGEGMVIKGTKDSPRYLTPDLQHSNFPQSQTSDQSISSTQHGFIFFLGTQFTYISQGQRSPFIWTGLPFVLLLIN